ncbi:MAG TPA: branched-chain amino acid ABC transporter permease, partial [Burkholderiaceae bacterium]|nr:branched-chain amino acid ABC transporter permease [Burkholderiaceae bacterium]
MPIDAIVNIVISGLLTGLVYGLMALGLSVIYGVVRIVNFAHGELMTVAMYAAVFAFALLGVDPLWMLVPVALAFFGVGYVLQRAIVNPFIDRPEHSQFILLLAVALVLVNVLLIAFGPDARNVQVDYALDSYQIGPLLVDKVRVICAVVALAACAVLFAIFRY